MYDDGDVLDAPDRHRRSLPLVEVRRGLVLEVADAEWVGEVVTLNGSQVVLRDRRGRERSFAIDGTFFHDDSPVRLALPIRSSTEQVATTRSGSIAVDHPTRVARASRIWVEGIHDAELLELIWGDDLRAEGIVVEPLGGIDDLEEHVARFGPSPDRRLGVLVDHLLPGTKEQRIAARVVDPHVLITGHPFIDVWAAVKPSVAGLTAWPEIPRGTPWKQGVCQAVGAADPASFWRGLLAGVSRFTDLDRRLVGAVEELLDFVTEEPT